MQRVVAEQAVNTFDVVFDGGLTGQAAPERAQRQLATRYCGFDRSQQATRGEEKSLRT